MNAFVQHEGRTSLPTTADESRWAESLPNSIRCFETRAVRAQHEIFSMIRGEKHEEISDCGFGSFLDRFIGLVRGRPTKWREDLTRKKRSEPGERKCNYPNPKTACLIRFRSHG
jgi:hypothetical protein